MNGRDWRLFGRLHTRLYKRLGGRFVGSVGLGRKVLLLTTTGRKSGKPRTMPQEHAQIWPKAKSYNPHWRTYAQGVTLLPHKHSKSLPSSAKDRSADR